MTEGKDVGIMEDGNISTANVVGIVAVVFFFACIGAFIGYSEAKHPSFGEPAISPEASVPVVIPPPTYTVTSVPTTPTLSPDYFGLHGGDYRK